MLPEGSIEVGHALKTTIEANVEDFLVGGFEKHGSPRQSGLANVLGDVDVHDFLKEGGKIRLVHTSDPRQGFQGKVGGRLGMDVVNHTPKAVIRLVERPNISSDRTVGLVVTVKKGQKFHQLGLDHHLVALGLGLLLGFNP